MPPGVRPVWSVHRGRPADPLARGVTPPSAGAPVVVQRLHHTRAIAGSWSPCRPRTPSRRTVAMRSGGGGRPPADRSPGPVRSRQGVDTIGPCVLHYRTEVLLTNESPQQSGHLLEGGWDILYLPEVRVLHHHATTWRLTDEARLSSQLRNKWTMAAELVPVPWIPGAVLPLTARTLCSLRRGGQPGATGRILGMAMRGFRTGWGARRPVSVRTVRRVLALRGRL